MPDINQLMATLPELSHAQRKELAIAAAQMLSAEDKKLLAATINPPAPSITNWIWMIVVCSFAFVVVADFLMLSYCVFHDKKTDVLLAVFTTCAGFLAGLLAPSPVSGK